MRSAVFVAPDALPATLRFVDAAVRLPGVRLGLVTAAPASEIPAELRSLLAGHHRLDNPLDPRGITTAITALTAQLGPVDRLVGTLEQLQVPLGEVRDALGIPGTGAEVAARLRDRGRLRAVLREAGVACARDLVTAEAGAARRFAGAVGYPVVVRPPHGSCGRDTLRIDGAEELESWLRADPPGADRPALVEEMPGGVEHAFDCAVVDGRVAWWSVSCHLPPPAELTESAWIQWSALLPRDLGAEFSDVREQAERAIVALGLRSGLCHLEWRRLPGGGLAITGVGARPPGAPMTSLLCYAHDADVYSMWARLAILDTFDAPERRWAVGAAYLRGQGGGRVRALHGLDRIGRDLGDIVVEARLPQPGQAPASSHEGDGCVIVRHPRTAVVEEALDRIAGMARIELAGEPG